MLLFETGAPRPAAPWVHTSSSRNSFVLDPSKLVLPRPSASVGVGGGELRLFTAPKYFTDIYCSGSSAPSGSQDGWDGEDGNDNETEGASTSPFPPSHDSFDQHLILRDLFSPEQRLRCSVAESRGRLAQWKDTCIEGVSTLPSTRPTPNSPHLSIRFSGETTSIDRN